MKTSTFYDNPITEGKKKKKDILKLEMKYTCSVARGQKIANRNTAVIGGTRKLVTDCI